MIPKQTPACNFRPATLPQTSLFSSLPLAPPRKSASSSSLIRPLCVQSKALNRNRLRRQGAPRRLLSCTARVIFRPAFPQGLSREGKLCAYRLPLETYGFQTAQRNMMPCTAIVCGCTVPLPYRLSSRAFRQNPRKKKRSPVRGFSQVCVWRDSNPRPSESESDALSSCATNTKYPTTIPCFAPESKAIFYSRLFRLCSAGFS